MPAVLLADYPDFYRDLAHLKKCELQIVFLPRQSRVYIRDHRKTRGAIPHDDDHGSLYQLFGDGPDFELRRRSRRRRRKLGRKYIWDKAPRRTSKLSKFLHEPPKLAKCSTIYRKLTIKKGLARLRAKPITFKQMITGALSSAPPRRAGRDISAPRRTR